jgi:hypothetical protein
MDEGARGAPRAINTYIISPAIDVLSSYQERGESLPSKLTAVATGINGRTADGKCGITFEVPS